MTHPAIRIIREEHKALASVMSAMLRLLDESRQEGTRPDFALLRSMVFYIDEFPQRRHHTKETELFFPKLRARSPLMRALLDQLDRDHAHGERHVRELEHALLAFEMLGEPRRAELERIARRHADFYLAHMGAEERDILPLAEQVLNDDDWADLNEAFANNRDPLTGHDPEACYRELFGRITAALPHGLPRFHPDRLQTPAAA
jgi:hemerythrin-like domain-containing protein